MSPSTLAHLSPVSLGEALHALPYRQALLLIHWLLQGRSLEDCAALYGISSRACSIHLLRAALDLGASVALQARAPVDDAEELAWAHTLVEALEREEVALPPALASTVALCRRLRAWAPEVAAAVEAAELAESRSPRRQREDFLRRLAVFILLALTALLYWHRSEEPPAPSVHPSPTNP